MPMVDITMVRGALTKEQRARLTEKLTHVLLVIEGGMNKALDNPASRSIAWVLYHEVAPEGFAVGGDPDSPLAPEGGKFRVVVTVPDGALDVDGRKSAVVTAVHGALREVLELPPEAGVKWAPWVIIHEVRNGNWGAGGLVRRLPDIARYAREGVPA
jgi:phenylpyruvate tautomerase PptA (4-oxalocrotonate tautomerase family)